jgi:uncharacterized membrane protein required for colicin V production
MCKMVSALIIVFLVICAALGYVTGFVWQAIRLTSVIACIWVAAAFSGDIAAFVEDVGEPLSPWVREFVVPLAVFIVALLGCYLVGFLFRGVINALTPKVADRFAGAFFGVLKGALVAGMVVLLAVHRGSEGSELHRAMARSIVAKGTAFAVYKVGSVAGYVLPSHFDESIRHHLGDRFEWLTEVRDEVRAFAEGRA